jgi:serine/threonine-protein kinase RsbW
MNKKEIKLSIESKMELIPIISKAVRSVCHTVIEDDTQLYHLELCVFEAIVNVIKHSLHEEKGHLIEVIVILNEDSITFKVMDDGKDRFVKKKQFTFDPEDIEHLPTSGMGVHIIYEIMDEVSFSSKGKKNILVMKFQKDKVNV